MKVRIGTFNMENLFLRYRVLDGERAGPYNPKPISFEEIAQYLEEYSALVNELGGAKKITEDPAVRKEFYKRISKMPPGKRILAKFLVEGGSINNLNVKEISTIIPIQRDNTARAIRGEDNEMVFPDILAVQEVENLQTLKQFNETYMRRHFKYMYLIDGNDSRQIDVGFLSMFPAVKIRTHQFIPDSVTQEHLFSRDCLEVDFAITNAEEEDLENIEISQAPILTFFNNHLKSHFIDWRKKGEEKDKQIEIDNERRKRQADEVAKLVKARFGDDVDKRFFVVCGDFNDDPSTLTLQELLDMGLENVVTRLDASSFEKTWTYYYEKEDTLHQYDYLLFSKALSEKNPTTVPIIERRGIAKYKKLQTTHGFNLDRFIGVGAKGTEASDHCPVYIEIEI
jgi:endonuclease/exonuclease/phosphatase family metal-dependent hydrolase